MSLLGRKSDVRSHLSHPAKRTFLSTTGPPQGTSDERDGKVDNVNTSMDQQTSSEGVYSLNADVPQH